VVREAGLLPNFWRAAGVTTIPAKHVRRINSFKEQDDGADAHNATSGVTARCYACSS